MKKIFISLFTLSASTSLFAQSAAVPNAPFGGDDCLSAYVAIHKDGTQCTSNTNPTTVSFYNLNGSYGSTILSAPVQVDNSNPANNRPLQLDGAGINKRDGFLYAMAWVTNSDDDCGTSRPGGIRLIRIDQNGNYRFLGTIQPPTNGRIITGSGCVDGYGNYAFLAQVGTQYRLGRVSPVHLLANLADNGTTTNAPVTYNLLSGGCQNFEISDMAIGVDGQYYSYGTYSFVRNNNTITVGQVVQINQQNYTIYCYGGISNEDAFIGTSNDVNNPNNFVGVMFDGFYDMYLINGTDRSTYKVNIGSAQAQRTGVLAGTGPVSADLASCHTQAVILPIDFISFSASAAGECIARLNWDVAGVENGDAFTIEKSDDGRSFTNLATVKGAAGTTKYTATDNKTGITNYYRIKAIGKDGSVKYSSIVRFLSSCGGKNNATLFTNLIANGNVAGEISLYKTQNVSYNIYSASGAKVFTKTGVTSAGVSRFSFNVPALSKGVYMIQILMGDEVKTEKFVVQ